MAPLPLSSCKQVSLRRPLVSWSSTLIPLCIPILAHSDSFGRVLAQLELDYNSVERIVEYLGVPQEAPAIIEDCRPPAYWPSTSGSLVVDDLTIRYAPDLPAVLRNISFTVKPSERIGVVCLMSCTKLPGAQMLIRSGGPGLARVHWPSRCLGWWNQPGVGYCEF